MSDTARIVKVGNVAIGNALPVTIISGPCQLETLDHALMIAATMAEICAQNGVGYIFKASFDKANRTSLAGVRGVGMDAGMEILTEVRNQIGCPVITDVHEPRQCEVAAQYVDALQIPAFLCRQTDLLVAAGKTGKPVNVKKGQFLAPGDMHFAAEKIASTGNRNILLCERGTSFGYNNLVVDMRAIPIMQQTGYPVVIDATHSVQHPGGNGASSGGQRAFAPVIAKAAVAVGVAAVFFETHQDPENAPSDGPNMTALKHMPALIRSLVEFDRIAKSSPAQI